MRKHYVIASAVVAMAVVHSASSETIGFEPPSYEVGMPLPAAWSIYNPSNAFVGITTSAPSMGLQCLAVGYNGGGAAQSTAKCAMDIDPSGSTIVAVDVRPAPFETRYLFYNYGGVSVFNDISTAEVGLSFFRESGQNHLNATVPGNQAILGSFTPGAYHRVTFVFDWDANTRTVRAESASGELIGEHTFTVATDRALTLVVLQGPGATGYANHFDELVIGEPSRVGDLDGDGVVGATDLAILLGAWGTGGSLADLDGDGAVGAADLALLLGSWG